MVDKRSHKIAGIPENSRPTAATTPGYDHFLFVSITHILVEDTGVSFDRKAVAKLGQAQGMFKRGIGA